MKVSYRWLQDYISTTTPALQLAEDFQLTSSVAEGVENWEERFKGLIIGKVLQVQQHPQADRLHLAEVQVSSKKKLSIVCGAPNLAEGQTVIVALPGTVIYPLKGEPITIQESTIRGQVSHGMLCGAEEIGLALAGEDGIVVLDTDHTPGTSAASALNLDDSVIDLEITPNRPDLLSYLGLAREVSAFEKKGRLNEPPIASLEHTEAAKEKPLHVEIERPELCLRYCSIRLENIVIKPSPLWLQIRLLLSGVRPINNVVDITNYCMLEYGQPLHAFDARSLDQNGIKVRAARTKENLTLLDGSQRELENGDIVISNANDQALGLAGVMGGQKSSIQGDTTSIVIESAVFPGPAIRRTSRRLGLRSEASSRFEKGLDPELSVTTLKRAVYLLENLCQATLASNLVDIYPTSSNPERPRIHLTFAHIQQVAGVHISAPECKGILQRLGFQLISLTKSSFEAVAPSWRRDVQLPEDIIEELVRLWGFDRLPSTLPLGPVKPPQPNPQFVSKQKLRTALAASGLHECLHLSLVSSVLLKKAGFAPEKAIRLPHPLSSEGEYLKPSQLVSLVNNLGTVNSQISELGLFEIGTIFTPPLSEQEQAGLILRSSAPIENLYRQVKSIFSYLSIVFALEAPQFTAHHDERLESALAISIQGQQIGYMGALRSDLVSQAKVRSGRSLVYAEINLEAWYSLKSGVRLYQSPPLYPTIERTLSLVVAEEVPVQAILDHLNANMGRDMNVSWQVGDIFRGKPLPSGRKSVSIHFTYSAPDRTLEDAAVNQEQARLTAILHTQFPQS